MATSSGVPTALSQTSQQTVSHAPSVSTPKDTPVRTARTQRKARKAARRYYASQVAGERQATKTAKQTYRNQQDPYRKELNALTTERYGGAQSALERQQAQIPGVFNDYRDRLTALQTAQAQRYQAAMTGLGQFADQLGNAGGQAIQASAPGTQQPVLDDAAKAAQVRQQMLGGFGGLVTSQGLAEGDYLTNRSASSNPLQAQYQTQASQSLADLANQKGAYRVSARADLQKADADAQAEAEKNRIALQIAGINSATDLAQTKITTRGGVKKTRITSGTSRANNINTNATSRSNNAASNAAKQQAAAEKNAAQGTKDSQARHQASSKVASTFDDLATKYNLYKSQTVTDNTTKKTRKPTDAEIRQRLISEGADAQTITLAIKRANGTRFTKQEVAQAKRLGFIVPKRLRPVKLSKSGAHGDIKVDTGAEGNVAG